MASNSQNRVPMKKMPIAATPLPWLPIHGFFGLILLYIIIEWGRKIFNILTSQFSVHSNYTIDSGLNQKLPRFREDEISIGRDEVETVLSKLGISCHPESEGGEKRLSSKDFIGLFGGEEEEDGGFELDEVKAAFDVFDENKDGFIEEKELQRVMCALGLKEGLELENCRNMMRMFDQDGDGRIDFSEFCALF
ncbi:probable calcium-binding protein CML45 [Ipomoea triloba]|uniref:probable calcium-binding protein CML45 n=1 Tax=Ipomoea triloba TaxID=35885 RepID=UPI00125D39BC|nr:probable calcium-binding protein CML45 [Ipomoea triloba]